MNSYRLRMRISLPWRNQWEPVWLVWKRTSIPCMKSIRCSVTAVAVWPSLPGNLPDAGAPSSRAFAASEETGSTITPEIMIPLVCDVDELRYVKAEIVAEIEEVFSEKAATIPYLIGTMIEIPRAAVTSDEIAQAADFSASARTI